MLSVNPDMLLVIITWISVVSVVVLGAILQVRMTILEDVAAPVVG